MRIPLPPIPQQKKLIYRPSIEDAIHVYDALNQCIFDNQLTRPTIYLKPRCRKYWGLCYSDGELHDTGSYCEIRLMDKWYCVQWMVTILAHEACHQAQYDLDGIKREAAGKERIMSHGPSFFEYRERMNTFNIPLKTAYRQRKWMMIQDLMKC